MKRKLVKQGLSALTLTLPAPWIKQHGLSAGDEVEVAEVEGIIQVATSAIARKREIAVDVSGLTPRLADRFLARAYQKGYDKIIIKFDDVAVMRAIQQKVPELMGFEILSTGKGQLEIQVIAAQLDLDFDTMLRRGLLLLLEMTQTCHDAWKAGDREALTHLMAQDIEVNKFIYFCLRHLNTSAKMVTFGTSILYYLIESLEDLGDELKALGQVLVKLPLDTDVLKLLSKLNRMFRMSYEFFYAPKREAAVGAFALSKEITGDVEKLLGTKNRDLAKVLMGIEFCNRIIYHLTTMRLDTLRELRG